MKGEIKPGQKVHHECPMREIRNGEWVTRIDVREVMIMAVADKWAMVRRAACMPYVALVRELKPLPTPDPGT